MDIMETYEKFDELDKKFKECTSVEERQQLATEWWGLALGAYNEHIAGTVTFADGTTHTIPTIEI